METSKLKRVLKAITWRIIAAAVTFIVSYFIFKDTAEGAIGKSLLLVSIETVVKLTLYYFHELGWDKMLKK